MKTLYVDVYFLINFTVDVLSLYFASCFSKVPTTKRRLIIASALGGTIAVLVVLLPELIFLKIFAATVGLIVIGYAATVKVTARRRIKFILSFIVFEALMGGAVTFIWELLDKYISGALSPEMGGAFNRKMLLLSLIVLLSIGVFKMLVSFFSNIESEGSVVLELSFLDKKTTVSAFVDSGNLCKDPMDLSPVILVKKDVARSILPNNIIELCDIDSLDRAVKKRIRLIPVTRGGETHVLVGVKMDSVKAVMGEKAEVLRVTIAIDKEGGSYGGFKALLPSAALDNVITK